MRSKSFYTPEAILTLHPFLNDSLSLLRRRNGKDVPFRLGITAQKLARLIAGFGA
jgi:hypothetical protein